MDYVAKTWRLELFFKTLKDLTSKQLPIVKEHNITRFNLTNKVKVSKFPYQQISLIISQWRFLRDDVTAPI